MAIVTFSSDFSNQNYLVGAVKGILLQTNPNFNIVDISHQLSSFNYPQSAYLIRTGILHFPKETFHLLLLNLFDEHSNHLLLAHVNNQYIGCADNGLLPMIFEELNNAIVVALPIDNQEPKTTLYFTRVIAHAFNNLQKGTPIEKLGKPVVPKSKGTFPTFEKDNGIDGQIIFIDNFENVVVNITREVFEAKRKGRKFSIILKGNEVIDKISETYADVPEGEKLALFNSAGFLEIAINKGNAAGLLGLQLFSEKEIQLVQQTTMQRNLLYQTVKIFFGD